MQPTSMRGQPCFLTDQAHKQYAVALPPDVSGMHRFKEEAEASTTDLKEQLVAAHQERHAVEEQAKQQVKPDMLCLTLHMLKGCRL